ncbi:MAG TPA: ECF transporter S component, partial [Erysipelotrichaceae bacterium]|nr:ECF transporter S component [Erysipelotrichaceae bacterium]
MNQRQSIQRITRLGILIAIIVLMTFVPNIGYIQTGLLSITTIHIPVIVGSALLGPIGGLVLGTTWG